MKKICFAFTLLSTALLSAQVTIKDEAKVGLLVTGTGNTINTTQIFGKSPEYAELKKRLDGLQAAITQKAEECGQMEKDALPAKYRDNCRATLIALNAERDSVQKIEARFREDVIRLAETFANIPLNSERLRLAKQFFEEGKIREADNILNAKEMQQEGDALLAKKERAQQALQMTDSLLRIKADEFALKARLKATDYGDSLRYDSAQIYFEQSQRYAETVENLSRFSEFLYDQNQSQLGIKYLETAFKLAHSEREEAYLAMNSGVLYKAIQKVDLSEKMYLRSLEIYKRLSKLEPTRYEPDLARVALNLGNLYADVQKMDLSEKMYLRSLEIYDRLSQSNPTQYEPDLARVALNLGSFYHAIQKMDLSEKMYLRSLEIRERLSKLNPAQYEPDLARTAMNLGVFYQAVQKIELSEKMYLRSLEIYERLSKLNPAQYEPYLATTDMNLGVFYSVVQKMDLSEKMYLRSLEIREQLSKLNPAQYEPDLARTAMNLGFFYQTIGRMDLSEKMYLRSLEIRERLSKLNPAQYEPYLAKTMMGMGAFYQDVQQIDLSGNMYLGSLEIYERLSKSNPAQFEPDLATIAMSLGIFYFVVQKIEASEKMFLRSLEIYERLAKSNPAQFEPDLANLSNNLGLFYNRQGKLALARKYYSKSLALRIKAVLSGQTHFLKEVIRPYIDLADIRDSFAMRDEWPTVVAIQKERADYIYSVRHLAESLTKQAPQDYGSLSRYCLLAHQYPEAQAAAERALELDSTQNWVRTNLAHSYLLRSEWPKAKAIYEQYLAAEKDPAEAKKTLEKDWNDLEAAGVTHKDMAKARAWLKE